mmetsp:Transcript_16933/g.51368  ORF Transcript_16933/g.51368 Transcript_16933/m.51368 type:complete len:370 (-) Transcript_16933:348-1457(-)
MSKLPSSASLKAAESVVKAVEADPALLEAPELAFLKNFKLGISAAEEQEPEEEEEEEEETEDGTMAAEKETFPVMPTNAAEAAEDADWSIAAEKKAAAAQEPNLKTALGLFTEALEAEAATASLSASSIAKRAECLLKLKRPAAAIRDCDEAIKLNPDSAKALKVRGKAHRLLGDWTQANLDLAAAQKIDFDPDLKELCDLVKAKAAEMASAEREKQRAADLAKRKAAAAEKRKREQQAREQQARPPQPPAGGRPDPSSFMNDPSFLAAMQNPKVMAAIQEMTAGGAPDPAKMMKYMNDPEVGPVLQKMMGAAQGMGGMPGMPGMGGGMPGMGGMGGGGGASAPGGGGFDMDDNDDDDMPELEEVDEVD